MTGVVIGLIIVVVILIVVVVLLLSQRARTNRLRGRFGPEYDRTTQEANSPREAEDALRDRERRHATLELRALTVAERDRYATEWARVQEEFVDAPANAVADADRLVTGLMSDRGYPTEAYDQQIADLSVEHANVLDHYRRGHAIGSRAAGHDDVPTEDLRQAMIDYRALFDALLTTEHAGEMPPGERHGDRDEDRPVKTRRSTLREKVDEHLPGAASSPPATDGRARAANPDDLESRRHV